MCPTISIRRQEARRRSAEGRNPALRYELREELGRGGMGAVYRAVDRATGENCAVKMIGDASNINAASLARWQNEASALASLTHPNIVHLLNHGRTNSGLPYLVMELIAGDNLTDLVQKTGPLDVACTLAVLSNVCHGLSALHARGFAHGDVKPANIMLARRAEQSGQIKLIDLGLATPIPCTNSVCGGGTGASFAGSPHYAAPEAICGQVDARSDIYSLGATAYYLLAGQPVFTEQTPLAALAAHAERTPLSLAVLRTGLPAELTAIVMTCLEKDPARRYQSAAELEAALAAVPASWPGQNDRVSFNADGHESLAANDDAILAETIAYFDPGWEATITESSGNDLCTVGVAIVQPTLQDCRIKATYHGNHNCQPRAEEHVAPCQRAD